MEAHDEILMLVLSAAAMTLTLVQRAYLTRIPYWRLLVFGFALSTTAWAATVLEHFCLPEFFNYVEHAAYACSAAAIGAWCWLRPRADGRCADARRRRP